MTGPGDLRVTPARLDEAAAAAVAVADTVRSSDVAGALRRAGTALPGSATGAAAPELAGRWGADVAALADAVARHAASVRACSDAYRRTERATAESLRLPEHPATPAAARERGPEPRVITRALG